MHGMHRKEIKSLITAIRKAPIEPGMPYPEILLIAPPPIQTPKGPIAEKFLGGEHKCLGLAEEYAQAAKENDCFFLDAAQITTASQVDGIHLDKGQHYIFGRAVAAKVKEIAG